MTKLFERRNASRTALSLLATTTFALTSGPAMAQAQCGQWEQVAPPAGSTLAVIEVEAAAPDDAWAIAYSLGLVRWDGTTWDQFPIDDPNGSYSSIFMDRFCLVGPTHLFLAGRGDTGPFSNDQVLKIWDGSEWSDWHSLTLQPNSIGAPRNGAANAVAGAAIDDVWIVGAVSGLGTGVGGSPVLTVHWDGSDLTEYVTPGFGNYSNHLNDAVALATDDVWAVGRARSLGSTPGVHGAIYHWDGSSWSYVPNPTESSSQSTEFYKVAAIAPDDIWAAGSNGVQPLFAHWDGSSWSVVPSPATTGTIYGLTAIASDDVWAVDVAAQVPVIGKYYHWNGVVWSVITPPTIPGATTINRHGGLAKVGACDVWAVGSIDYGAGLGPYIERLQAVPPSYESYCTAGISASGCQATLSAFGTPSASSASGFTVYAAGVEGAKDGLFFFGANGRQANPWGNSTSYQCVTPPITRGGMLTGVGTNNGCDGSFDQDLNALWCPSCPKPGKNPGAGAMVQAQLWYRDPSSVGNQTTSLSDAIEFSVAP